MADTAYFLVADLLGFGRIVNNSSEQELDQRILAWTKLVDTTATAHGLGRLQLISDTLFVAANDTEHELLSLIAFSRELLSKGIAASFPVRGAIVRGSYVWGKLTYGRAVVAAHSLEQAQNWVGITCDFAIPEASLLWALDRLICYPAPMKRARMQLYPAVSWEIPETEKLMRLMTSGGLSKANEVLTWELGEKANNTILFRLYQDFLRHRGAPCSKFYGTLPVHPIEARLAGA